MHFVVLSSSRGTTFGAVADRLADKSLQMQCYGLITDKPDRGCIDVAKSHNIPAVVVEKLKGEAREDYDRRLDRAVVQLLSANGGNPRELRPDTVVCALGWMWILTPWFVREWKGKIVNVHPSLLPKYPGAHAITEALAGGEKESGMTIHIVDEGIDTGKILLQKSCAVEPGETEESLTAKIQTLEKEWYPKVLQQIYTREVVLD